MDRFWSKTTEGLDGCMIWTAAKYKKTGYGIFQLGKSRRAHRVAWELTHGPIEDGLHVLHRCDNPACVNPDHLFLGTHEDNMRDRTQKKRGNPVRGEANLKAKLETADILVIRSSPASCSELARRYGVVKQTIANIKNKASWKHV